MSLVDLVKSVKANCTVQSSTLISCAGPLQVTGLTNTAIDGAGVEIQFADPTAGNAGVTLSNANGAVLSNFKISWLGGGARDAIVPGVDRIQSLGNVAACTNQQQGGVLVLDLPLNGTQQLGAISVWDDTQGWPWYQSAPANFEMYFPTGTTAQFSNGSTRCIAGLAGFVGDRVVVRHIVMSNHAFHCLGCQNVTVQNVTITSAPGMGFVFESGGTNISLIGDTIAPKCAPNCSSAEPSLTADAAHFADISGNILLENNDFGWQGDDDLNITGLLAPAVVDTSQSGAGPWLQVSAAWQNRLWTMTVGSDVSLYDPGLNALGVVKVLAVEPASGLIELSSLPANTTNFVISRTDGIPKNVVIRNNQFHDNRARGILIGGSDALIENNQIERVTMEAILVPGDDSYWYEGPGAQNVTIQDNTISEVNRFPASNNPSAISAGTSLPSGYSGPVGTPIQNVLVQGNTFSDVYTNPTLPVSIGPGASGTISQQN
jgi:parallel beta-helix repeat protein